MVAKHNLFGAYGDRARIRLSERGDTSADRYNEVAIIRNDYRRTPKVFTSDLDGVHSVCVRRISLCYVLVFVGFGKGLDYATTKVRAMKCHSLDWEQFSVFLWSARV